MIFGKPKATDPYLTRALEAIDAEKFSELKPIKLPPITFTRRSK